MARAETGGVSQIEHRINRRTLLACGGLGYLTYAATEEIAVSKASIEAEERKATDARTKIAKIRGLEDELEKAGAPYTPGRLPVWQ